MGRAARRAFMASGKSMASAPLAVSGVAGDTQVQVSWTAPLKDGGSPITDYQLTVSPATGVTGGVTRLTGQTTTSYVFNGLANDTPYSFIVRAVTARGIGAASDASAPVTPVTGSAPATPSFTSIVVNDDVVTHTFATVAGATLYRIEIEKVG